ncbi:MAG TPA: hypothetical protein VGK77_02490, partial [Candidatus Binatia bacterium]
MNAVEGQSVTLSQPSKPFSHQVNLSEILLQAVRPTTFPGRDPEASRDEGLSSLQSAQVNHGSQFLFLSHRDACIAAGIQRVDNAPVEQGGSHFARMARQRPNIKIVKPTGIQVVPWTIGHNLMIPDAILPGFSESSV